MSSQRFMCHQTRQAAPGGPTSARGITAPAPLPAGLGQAPGPRLVRRHVDRILASEDFDAPPRGKDFSRYIVEEALAGGGEELTQSAIAARVFRRRDDFDATTDPIVRIHAGLLRRSLERYYVLAGKHETMRIELPRGTCVPRFRSVPDREPSPVPNPPTRVRGPRRGREGGR